MWVRFWKFPLLSKISRPLLTPAGGVVYAAPPAGVFVSCFFFAAEIIPIFFLIQARLLLPRGFEEYNILFSAANLHWANNM